MIPTDRKYYTSSIDFIFNHYIREYDIRKANISILHEAGIISGETYARLYNADRMQRQVYIGNMIKENKYIGDKLADFIIKYKEEFFSKNMIKDYQVLSIKNDAVFLIDTIPMFTKFGKTRNIEFVLKNTYTHFMKLDRLEIYYGKSFNQEVIDVKGIKDEDLEKYHMPFLNIILDFFRNMNDYGAEKSLDYISSIIDAYLRKDLGIEYYRNFRSNSDYVMNSPTAAYSIISVPEDYNFDINYNLYLLRQMHKYACKCLYEKINRG